MKQTPLHIIALDNPCPPDYGGAIDIYYKILALAEAGADITLHVFHKQSKARELDENIKSAVSEAYFYPRRMSPFKLFLTEPFIVSSRRAPDLLKNLKPEGAILFEGVHTTGQIDEIRKTYPSRTLALRAHNDESLYYKELAEHAESLMKRAYFAQESGKLAVYEKEILAKIDACFPISQAASGNARAQSPNPQRELDPRVLLQAFAR